MVLTSCTVGKGNLILRDLGKMAFSFHRRGGTGFRAVLRPESRAGMDDRMGPLMGKEAEGKATDAERAVASIDQADCRMHDRAQCGIEIEA